eukprot:ANDGO_06122.mRNA.1 Dynein 16 kDa light chain
MPPKLAEVQVTVDTAAEFDSFILNSPFVIAELYSSWSGSCKSVVPTFRKWASDNDDVSITFLTVDSQKVYDEASKRLDRNPQEKFAAQWPKHALKYKGRSMPVFLFFVKGTLKDSIELVDIPKLNKTFESLVKEFKVANPQAVQKTSPVKQPGQKLEEEPELQQPQQQQPEQQELHQQAE